MVGIMFPLIPVDLLSYPLNSFICSHSYRNRCFFLFAVSLFLTTGLFFLTMFMAAAVSSVLSSTSETDSEELDLLKMIPFHLSKTSLK